MSERTKTISTIRSVLQSLGLAENNLTAALAVKQLSAENHHGEGLVFSSALLGAFDEQVRFLPAAAVGTARQEFQAGINDPSGGFLCKYFPGSETADGAGREGELVRQIWALAERYAAASASDQALGPAGDGGIAAQADPQDLSDKPPSRDTCAGDFAHRRKMEVLAGSMDGVPDTARLWLLKATQRWHWFECKSMRTMLLPPLPPPPPLFPYHNL